MEAKEAMATARGLAYAVRAGVLSYDSAKEKAQPYLDIVNAKGKEIAKKYNRSYHNVTFTGLGR